VQTITSAESIPYKDGPIETLGKSLPTMGDQALQLQEFAEGIAKLIQQVPVVRGEIEAIKASNEERKAAENAVRTIVAYDPSHANIYLGTRRIWEYSTSEWRLPLRNLKPSIFGLPNLSKGYSSKSRWITSMPPFDPFYGSKLTS
jgi:hypothetical protein